MVLRMGGLGLLLVGLAVLVGCESKPSDPGPFAVSSPALTADGLLQARYGASPGEADNLLSFPFQWTRVPPGTKAIALIMLDKDYYNYIHWTAADIDPALGGLPEDASRQMKFPQGRNDNNGADGYIGPLPPNRHQYVLTVYALSEPTGLQQHFWMSELEEAMKGRILAQAELSLPFEPYQK